MTERELLLSLKAARELKDKYEALLKAAKEDYDAAEQAIIEHLEGIGADSTASFDGIGYASLAKPRVFASCLKENEDALKEWLKEKKREDLIKEQVHAGSLSAFVAELIESGHKIPEFINYYLKTKVTLH